MTVSSLEAAPTQDGNPTSNSVTVDIDYNSLIDQVVIETGLRKNDEQLRAFEIVARHVCFGGTQLLMYMGGIGGTGKSYIVQAILRLFNLLAIRTEITPSVTSHMLSRIDIMLLVTLRT